MKPIRLTHHAREQAAERGATEAEVRVAVERGARESAKLGRILCRYNVPLDAVWAGQHYAIKQVAPVIREESQEIVVITVYTFYF